MLDLNLAWRVCRMEEALLYREYRNAKKSNRIKTPPVEFPGLEQSPVLLQTSKGSVYSFCSDNAHRISQ